MSALLDLLLPRLCPGCGRRLVKGEGVVCPRCLMELTLEWDYDWRTNPRMVDWAAHDCLQKAGALTAAAASLLMPRTAYAAGNVVSASWTGGDNIDSLIGGLIGMMLTQWTGNHSRIL